MTGRAARRALAALTASALAAVPGVSPVSAQDAGMLASSCAAAGDAGLGACADGAMAARALQGHLGLLAGLGSPLPGAATTLGLGLGGKPRVALSVRAAIAGVGLPDHAAAAHPAPRTTFSLPAVHASVTVGLFDGFFLNPTAGGFLSLDVMAGVSELYLPDEAGFRERAYAGWYGARLGVLRETFDLPGISLSAARRSVSEITLGAGAPQDLFSVTVDPEVWSLRATVAKDLYAVGVLAGVGWDAYGGPVTLRMSDAMVQADDFGESRFVYFGGASLTLLVLQVSVEAGAARGYDPVAGPGGASFDARAPTYFGSLAMRLTL